MEENVQVLGNFDLLRNKALNPKTFEWIRSTSADYSNTIDVAMILDNLSARGSPRMTVRCPDFKSPGITNIYEWHRDGGGRTMHVLSWSNVLPTEILLPDGEVFVGEPNDLVLFDNRMCQHRSPPELFLGGPRNRWFLRIAFSCGIGDVDLSRITEGFRYAEETGKFEPRDW